MTSAPACSITIDWARTIHLRLVLPVQILKATSETFASRPLCVRSVTCLAASTWLDRHASFGRHVAPHYSAHFVYLCLFSSVFLLVTPMPSIWPHFGVGRLHALYPVNREAVPLVHIFTRGCSTSIDAVNEEDPERDRATQVRRRRRRKVYSKPTQ